MDLSEFLIDTASRIATIANTEERFLKGILTAILGREPCTKDYAKMSIRLYRNQIVVYYKDIKIGSVVTKVVDIGNDRSSVTYTFIPVNTKKLSR